MLASKRSARVTPKMNLRNQMHAGNKHASKVSTLTLKPRLTQKSKTGVLVAPHSTYASKIFFKKKLSTHMRESPA